MPLGTITTLLPTLIGPELASEAIGCLPKQNEIKFRDLKVILLNLRKKPINAVKYVFYDSIVPSRVTRACPIDPLVSDMNTLLRVCYCSACVPDEQKKYSLIDWKNLFLFVRHVALEDLAVRISFYDGALANIANIARMLESAMRNNKKPAQTRLLERLKFWCGQLSEPVHIHEDPVQTIFNIMQTLPTSGTQEAKSSSEGKQQCPVCCKFFVNLTRHKKCRGTIE